MEEKNYKGLLLTFCHTINSTPIFYFDSIGPPHDPRFICKVFIDNKLLGEAEGKQKKEAGNKAAKKTLEALGYRQTGFQPDFIVILYELCQKKSWACNLVETDHIGPSLIPEFTCSAKVKERLFPDSSRKKNKKLAKKEAAYLALKELKKEFPNDIQELPDVFKDDSKSENWSNSGSAGDISLDRSTGENGLAQLKTGDTSLDRSAAENGLEQPTTSAFQTQLNCIAILNEFCQKKKFIWNFVEPALGGPSYNLQFSFKTEIKGENFDKTFPESKLHSTKKLAKKEAAFLACRELKKEFPIDMPEISSGFPAGSLSARPSITSPGNRTSSESGIAGSVTKSSEVTFPSFPTPSSPERISLETGLDNLSLTDSKLHSPSSPSSFSFTKYQNPLREFEDVTVLDSGSFGQVFKAKKILDDRYYAVKEIPMRHKAKRHLEEVKALARLEHSNIVRYFNAWWEDNPVPFSQSSEHSSNLSDRSDFKQKKTEMYLFIQMELCENGSLKRWIKQRNSTNIINKHQSLQFFKQIVEAVKYIHSQGLIHRDLKPANILFTKAMVVKIGDFGLVTQTTSEDESEARQRTQGTGTPSYMAPEQRGNLYENEVDIYALGLILVELLWILYSGHERAVQWMKIRKGDLPMDFVKCYTVEVYQIKRMLSEDQKKRPSAEQIHEFFEANLTLDSRTL